MNNDNTPPRDSSSPPDSNKPPVSDSKPPAAAGAKDGDKASGKSKDKPAPAAKTAAAGAGTGPSRQSPQQPSPQKQPAKKRRGWFGRLLQLVILAALGAAAYYFWPHYGDSLLSRLSNVGVEVATDSTPATAVVPETAEESVPDAETVLSAEGQSIAAQAEQGDDPEALREELETRLAAMELSLNSVREQVREMSTTTRTDWLLAEAEYLLRLASQRLLIERQTANALDLMASADAILRDLDDVDLFAVRKALAQDMTRLRMAGVVDREGLYLQLEALIAVAGDLTVPLPRASQPEAPEPEQEAEAATWYQRLADNAWRALRRLAGLVRVERRDVPQAPMVTLEEEALLRYNLRAMLEQAQLALMQEEQAVYDAALAKAHDWVAAAFAEDVAARGFLEQLSQLQDRQVAQPLPSASASLKALQDYIDLRHSRGGSTGGRER